MHAITNDKRATPNGDALCSYHVGRPITARETEQFWL